MLNNNKYPVLPDSGVKKQVRHNFELKNHIDIKLTHNNVILTINRITFLNLHIIAYTLLMEFQYLSNNFPPGKSFIILPNPEFSVIHVHKDYELKLITSGQGKRIVGNNISAFENGDLILVGPELPHGHEFILSEQNDFPECLALIISETFISGGLTQPGELEAIRQLFAQAQKGLAFKGDKLPAIAAQLRYLGQMNGFESFIGLMKLLNTLTGIEDQEIISLSPEFYLSSYKDIDQIKIVYDFVFRNLQNTITLDTAAGLLHMAPGSFCRFFKKRTGKSFIQYVKDIRISHACNLLSNSELPIAQICFESGYSNLANFNFYFKSIMKMTPSVYRKNFR